MNHILTLRLFILFLVIYGAPIKAETHFSLAPSLINFDYTEFTFNNNVLNKETGWIPGIQFQITQTINEQLNIELDVSYYDGTANYTGHTQSGLSHNTQTDEQLLQVAMKLITALATNTDIYLSTKNHQWDRNIQGSKNTPGIFETYQWWEMSVGARTAIHIKGNQSWLADISVLKTINPTIYVDLSSIDAGHANLELGSDTGARLQLMWKMMSDKQNSYGINIFYETWDFGISNSKTTIGGSRNESIFEPRSETRHSGIQLLLNF